MPLSDVAIRSAKALHKPYKLSDANGLYLLVTPAGGRLWRLKYRLHGVEKKLALGQYPEVSLAAARKAREAAREAISAGQDPSLEKRRKKIAARLAIGTTFDDVAAEYIAKVRREGLALATITKLEWVREWLRPAIGHRPVDQVEPHELLAVLKRQETAGNLETAKRTRAFASRVFRFAVATARAKADPAAVLVGAVAAPRHRHFAAILEEIRIGELLRAIDAYSGQAITKAALSLSPHVFVRPGELRKAEWIEIDESRRVWRIPSARMKQRREHVVPLSTQSISILRGLRSLSGEGRYLFPAIGEAGRTMSENTVNLALRRMGFGANEMTAHGFRAMASTSLNESGKWSADAIERALSHSDADQVRAAYHRGTHWAERVEMAQWWSDHLDQLRNGADPAIARRDVSAPQNERRA